MINTFHIHGPTKLNGVFKVGGSKNAILPIMAACLLSRQPVRLTGVPDITDVANMLEILKLMGVKISRQDDECIIHAQNVSPVDISGSLSGRMRASVLLLGPTLARCGQVKIAQPGGDMIGARPLDTHLRGLVNLGVDISQSDNYIFGEGTPKAADITLSEISVTATENLIMAAILSRGTTTIRLAACEPHVVSLCDFLIQLGAKIKGGGSHTITIEGVSVLKPGEYHIPPDYLEAGTIAIAAAASRSELLIDGFIEHDNDAFLQTFCAMGVKFKVVDKDKLQIYPAISYKSTRVRTDIYPGFPSDLQAPLALLMTQADGVSTIFETLYEGRLNYFYQLQKMGVDARIIDAHTGTISGPTRLVATDLLSIDVRAGATLVAAALLAEGETILSNIEHIDRGYEKLDLRLNEIGANIKRY